MATVFSLLSEPLRFLQPPAVDKEILIWRIAHKLSIQLCQLKKSALSVLSNLWSGEDLCRQSGAMPRESDVVMPWSEDIFQPHNSNIKCHTPTAILHGRREDLWSTALLLILSELSNETHINISIFDPALIIILFKFNYRYLFPFEDLIKDSEIQIHVPA